MMDNKDTVRAAARRLGVKVGNTRDDGARSVARALADPAVVARLVGQASVEARALLGDLASRPQRLAPPAGRWEPDRYGYRPPRPRDAAEQLYDLGLLLASNSYDSAELPRETTLMLRGSDRADPAGYGAVVTVRRAPQPQPAAVTAVAAGGIVESTDLDAGRGDPAILAARLYTTPMPSLQQIDVAVDRLRDANSGMGFIRLPDDDVRLLAEAAVHGTAVWIKYESVLSTSGKGSWRLLEELHIEPHQMAAWCCTRLRPPVLDHIGGAGLTMTSRPQFSAWVIESGSASTIAAMAIVGHCTGGSRRRAAIPGREPARGRTAATSENATAFPCCRNQQTHGNAMTRENAR
jgi:hypothetical protein